VNGEEEMSGSLVEAMGIRVLRLEYVDGIEDGVVKRFGSNAELRDYCCRGVEQWVSSSSASWCGRAFRSASSS
jgi:hypothetical protein